MVTFMADTRSELTQALDMVLDDEGVMGALGNPRCKRFALVRRLRARSLPHFVEMPLVLHSTHAVTAQLTCPQAAHTLPLYRR